MSDPPPDERRRSPRDELLNELLYECLERLEEGPTSVEEVLARLSDSHPDLVEEVRASLEALQGAGLLALKDPREGYPERLGDFRLLRRLGGGGMGVVFLAQQTSLRRRVALKVLRAEDRQRSTARTRFQREVEAAARLAHPGVVRVFAVGEEGGVPYLAMEYVPGCSLDRALRALGDRPAAGWTGADLRAAVGGVLVAEGVEPEAPWDAGFWAGAWHEVVLRIVRRVAEALQHAHEHGVLHRDVKPSNVMVTPDGRVLLCDFGLALLQDDDRLTRTGTELGSLPYMAPEQLEGRPVDARADVYGLGVTLYELLVRRNPFLRPDSSAATRRAVIEGRPEPIRRLERDLSFDLETVCARALQRDPAHRYASAGAFARDLRNLLERRPIEARRPGPWLHALRWVQRYPALAASLGALAGLLVAVPLLLAGQEVRAAERVKRQGDRALRAIDAFLTDAAGIDLDQVPQVAALRERLLREAITLYREIEADGGETRHQRARCNYHLASILLRQERIHEAEALLLECRDVLGALEAETPGDVDVRWDLGLVARDLASIWKVRNDPVALQEVRVARGWIAGLAAEQPESARYVEALGELAVREAGMCLEFGCYAEAEALYSETLAALAPVAERPDSDPAMQRGLVAQCLRGLGDLCIIDRRFAEALPLLERARERFLAVPLDEQPTRRHALAGLENQIGVALRGLERDVPAAEHLERAARLLEELYDEFPGEGYDRPLFDARLNLATARFQLGHWVEACAVFDGLVALAQERLANSEDQFGWRWRLASASMNLADLRRLLDEPEPAREAARRADELFSAMVAENPANRSLVPWLFGARAILCELALARADVAATEAGVDHLLELGAEPAVEEGQAARLLAKLVGALGEAHADAPRVHERALVHLERAVELGLGPAADLAHRDWNPLRADPRFERAASVVATRNP